MQASCLDTDQHDLLKNEDASKPREFHYFFQLVILSRRKKKKSGCIFKQMHQSSARVHYFQCVV